MTVWETIKKLDTEAAALVILKAVDECAVYYPFIDGDDRCDLKGNPCFERFKKFLEQENTPT